MDVRSWTIKEAECWRVDAFGLWCWRRLWRVPWTSRRSSQSILKEISRVFIGRTDVEAEAPILWPPDVKSWLTGKDPDVGRDWGQEEKGTTEDEMVGWYHWLNGHAFGWTPGVGDGQGGLACSGSWGCKGLDTTEQLNWTELKHIMIYLKTTQETPKEEMASYCDSILLYDVSLCLPKPASLSSFMKPCSRSPGVRASLSNDPSCLISFASGRPGSRDRTFCGWFQLWFPGTRCSSLSIPVPAGLNGLGSQGGLEAGCVRVVSGFSQMKGPHPWRLSVVLWSLLSISVDPNR